MSSETSLITFAGFPTTRLLLGMTVFAGTKHKAPMMHSSSITTSSMITEFIPIKQFSPIVPPCTIAP
ncbi:hypothetical protein D3C85_1618300 [compost metagenome]